MLPPRQRNHVLCQGDDLQIETSELPEDPVWDEFVLTSSDPHHEQLSLWGELQRLRGWAPVRLRVRRAGALIGGVQILVRPLGRLGRAGFIRRGPLVAVDDPLIRGRLVGAIQAVAKERRLTYLSVILPYFADAIEVDLVHAGFVVQPELLPPTTSEKSTVVVDLSPSPEEILSRMRTTTRRYIRQGERRGIKVCEGGASDVDTFSRLLLALCARRGVKPNVPTGEFLDEMWQAFAPKGHLKLFVSSLDNEAVGALMVIVMGEWARAWRVGWSGEHEEARPNEMIYWEAMKWSKQHGCRHFDFIGFDTQIARAIVEGREITDSVAGRLSAFKSGFGGRPMVLHPYYCYFPNPLARQVFRVCGRRLLDSPSVQRWVRRIGLRKGRFS